MFRSDKRNDRAMAAISTLIAAGTTIRGDVHFSGGLHLEGVVEGSISAEGEDAVLTLSDKGRVNGEVRVSNAVVNGSVNGDIFAAERLELAGNARITGNVHYKVLEMAAGAQINGKMLYQAEPQRRLPSPGLADDVDDPGAEPAHA
ncbi:cytoskeletal protein CcmA (bactofilin family) [Dokdonella fugitiva]|uniref:Cytoskeletal protein CcmA (Bactofilin family) n=1 Tax=Dokdonella fugitiva TaxID=328517 RepID=A0A839F751_9GAMM|nr:polymer-forming cytoskeletal protein [Dokdonella fugitiva]MBA8889589.1 cytoskeletal protein CcmA (bactofilin family) [Dokdonella fugitiva]